MKDSRTRAVPVQDLMDKLDGLRTALDEQQVKTVLAPMLERSLGEPAQVEAVAIEVLRSRSNRCLLRYALEVSRPQRATRVRLGVIAKVLRPGVGERVFENMRGLWTNGFGRDTGDGIGMPEPLGFVPSLNLLLQEEVPGVPFKMLVEQPRPVELFRQLGRALAKLHKCAFVPSMPFTVRDHLLRCHPKHEVLSQACPELAAPIAHLVERAYRVEAEFGAVAYTPIHGDFHLGQVHVQNGHAWLVDFDALCYGDPAADLGNVLVFLKARARKNPEILELTQIFLAEYFSLVDPSLARRIPLYESLTNLRRACKAMRLHEEGWERNAKRLVEAAVASLP